jgi:hypothetical protein
MPKKLANNFQFSIFDFGRIDLKILKRETEKRRNGETPGMQKAGVYRPR